jgi:hypothetical protein
MTSHGAATTTLAALLTFGLAACSSGESADAPEGERTDAERTDAAVPDAEVVRSVPVGTSMTFHVQETVSTESHAIGDVFVAALGSDVVDGRGEVLIPSGTSSRWMVTESSSDGGQDGDAILAFRLEAVQLGNEWTPLHATTTDAEINTGARDSGTETAAKVAVGAAAGAILGQIIGRDTESTLKGAGVGAVVGTAVALTTRGSVATLPEGSLITVRLDESVTVR